MLDQAGGAAILNYSDRCMLVPYFSIGVYLVEQSNIQGGLSG